MRGDAGRLVPKILMIYTLCLSLLTFMSIALPTVIYDAELDFVEGFMIYNGLDIIRGSAYQGFPYVYPYPPLAYIASAVSALGASSCPIVGCRILALTLSSAILFLAWFEAGGGEARLIAPAIIGLSPVFLYWAPLCRADQLATLLSITSIALASRGILGFSALAASLALFSKQTYIAAPLSILAYFLLLGRWREAAKYAALLLLFSLALYAPFIAFSGDMLNHLLFYNLHRIDPLNPMRIMRGAFRGGFWIIYLPALIFSLRRIREDPYAIYYVSSFVLASILALKVGANTNYFFEACVVGGVLVAREASRIGRKLSLSVLCLVLVASIMIASPIHLLDRVGDPSLVTDSRRIAEAVRGFRLIASEDAYIAVLSGSRLIVEPFIYHQLVARGVTQDILAKAAEGFTLDAGIFRWRDPERFTGDFVIALLARYNCVETRYYVLCVKPWTSVDLQPAHLDPLLGVQQAILAISRLILLFENWICLLSIFTLPPVIAYWWKVYETRNNRASSNS